MYGTESIVIEHCHVWVLASPTVISHESHVVSDNICSRLKRKEEIAMPVQDEVQDYPRYPTDTSHTRGDLLDRNEIAVDIRGSFVSRFASATSTGNTECFRIEWNSHGSNGSSAD